MWYLIRCNITIRSIALLSGSHLQYIYHGFSESGCGPNLQVHVVTQVINSVNCTSYHLRVVQNTVKLQRNKVLKHSFHIILIGKATKLFKPSPSYRFHLCDLTDVHPFVHSHGLSCLFHCDWDSLIFKDFIEHNSWRVDAAIQNSARPVQDHSLNLSLVLTDHSILRARIFQQGT